MFTRKERKTLSRIFNQNQALQATPLCDEPRRMYGLEDCIEYGFIQGLANASDKFIDAWFDENVAIHMTHMEWDCTGQSFTRSIRWHRNPNGDVSFVHRIGYDF